MVCKKIVGLRVIEHGKISAPRVLGCEKIAPRVMECGKIVTPLSHGA